MHVHLKNSPPAIAWGILNLGRDGFAKSVDGEGLIPLHRGEHDAQIGLVRALVALTIRVSLQMTHSLGASCDAHRLLVAFFLSLASGVMLAICNLPDSLRWFVAL
tara:strand:- start:287 stop:601 length:315 start_codon:yes stop_codon:yes gene_type:complete